MNDINDEYICNLLFKENSNKLKYNYKKLINDDIMNYLNNRFIDSDSIIETLKRIKYKIYKRPVCKICGGHVTYRKNDIFLEHCSIKCAMLDPTTKNKIQTTNIKKYGKKSYTETIEFREKAKQTYINHYGVDNNFKSFECIEKAKQTKLKKYGLDLKPIINKIKQTKLKKYGDENYNNREKAKQTYINHYGVEHNWKSKECREKAKQTCLKKYGDENYNNREKAKQTILTKYGCNDYNIIKSRESYFNKTGYNSPFENPYIVNIIINNNINKYGVKYYFETDDYKNYIKNKLSDKNFINKCKEKEFETKKKNNSFNISKGEDKLYKILCEKYGIENVIRQYYSNVYPFVCDFYIKSEKLYIEYQGNWTHGKHPFDETNPDDLKTLQLWKDKSMEVNFKGKQKRYYLNAIYTWTDLDVRKRTIAKQNNLNFIEIFNIKNGFKI